MNNIRLMSNGHKVAIENPQFTNASSSYERVTQPFTDPAIEAMQKQTHYPLYKELLTYQSNENLMNKGVIAENLFENDRVHQQLEDYDEYLHARKTQVCTPTGSEKMRQNKN